ncbi:hypothetical protein NC981_16085 [Leptolyngbya sp. DQ-M1]|uniref:alpha/beta fold hydrolase n=1 Tax=Leptolyngbya sp. DQ-M1 TaxID=2933920 RepID=UPI0032995242
MITLPARSRSANIDSDTRIMAQVDRLSFGITTFQLGTKISSHRDRHDGFGEWINLRYPIFALPGRKEPLIQMARTNLNLLGVWESVYQSLMQNLANITAPTLVIWGKQARIIPIAHAHIAAQNLPNAKFLVVTRLIGSPRSRM